MDAQEIGVCKGSDLGKGCWEEGGAGLAVLRWARGGGGAAKLCIFHIKCYRLQYRGESHRLLQLGCGVTGTSVVVGTEYVALSVERGSEEWVCRECSTVSCWCVDDVQGLCVDDIPRLCEDDNTVMEVLSERSCHVY